MFALWKKIYDKSRQCIKKQRYYFAYKGPYSQSYGFSSSHVRIWELDHKESWALKNWHFWTVVLEKTLESLLDRKRSNQSILKEISPEYSLEGLRLKLKLQTLATWCKELTHLKRPRYWERFKAGEERDNKGWLLDGIMDSMDMSLSKHWELEMNSEAWHGVVHGLAKNLTTPSNWTELIKM